MARRIVIITDGHTPKSSGVGIVVVIVVLFFIFAGMGHNETQNLKSIQNPPPTCTSAECLKGYGEFLSSNSDRAFVVGRNGIWAWSGNGQGITQAGNQAISACIEAGGESCQLVVLNSEPVK
jgi:hypothetical protein